MSGYLIPAGPYEATYEIKNSHFIASVRPIRSMVEMKLFVKELREKHPKANHNCWAVITGSPMDSNTYGFSDDGEPSGTAGKPLFTVLLYSGSGQVGVVVTRYFGGIKLGAGGLVKAYTASAKAGLEATSMISYSPMKTVVVTIPYKQEPYLRYLIDQEKIGAEFTYNHAVTAQLTVRENDSERVVNLLNDSLGVAVGVKVI